MPYYLDGNGAMYGGDPVGSDPELPDRPSPEHQWDGSAWALPVLLLEQIQAAKIESLNQICTAMIDNGFESEALGTTHRYSSRLSDQFNLVTTRTIAIELGQSLPYVCTALSDGIKEARVHTPAQISQVFFDGLALKQSLIFKFHSLRLAVGAAQTAEAVAVIVWD